MNKARTIIILFVTLFAVGCVTEKRSTTKRFASRRTARCFAKEVIYEGWRGLRMTNGLVTVVTVPAIGGRTMVYNLGGYPFLFVNPDELGKTYPPPKTEEERKWHNFGGYKVWPAPQSEWGGPGDPLGSCLDGGEYTGEIVRAEEEAAEIKVASPIDGVIGLQYTRTLRIYPDTTRVSVGQTMTNISDKQVEWGLWDVTQVRGRFYYDEEFSDQAWIYFPLNPKSVHENGFIVLNGEKNDEQWKSNAASGIMGVQYLRRQGKIGADSAAGWIAYVDQAENYVYVKRFQPLDTKAKYPDGGCSVEVWTNPGLPYMEVEVLSPLKNLKPGESYSFNEEWYACRCPGPIVDVNDLGATNNKLTATIEEGKLQVTGTFGVFVPGVGSVLAKNAEGDTIKTMKEILVDPRVAFSLQASFDAPEGAKSVEIEIRDHAGEKLGVLAGAVVTGE